MQERNYNADDCIDNPKSVFTVLTPKEKEFLKQNYTCAFYKKGEIIFKEGDKPMGLMILAEGKVKIFKEGVGGSEQIVRMAKPVGFIGYRALFAEENHTATAVAIEDCVSCIVDKESVYRVIRSNAELSMSIIAVLCFRTRFLTRQDCYSDPKAYPGSSGRVTYLFEEHLRI